MKFSVELSRSVTGKAIKSSVVTPRDAQILRELGASNRRMQRLYEAAVSNALNADLPINVSSGNAEVFTSILPTRARTRTLERDNPYAWAMIQSIMANVGGHEPFKLEMKVGKKTPEGEFKEESDTNDAIEEWWVDAGLPENCTTRRDMSRLELDLQAIAAMVRDGGYLGRHWRAFPKNKYFYALQPLEIDRLDHYYNGKNEKSGNRIIMSKEVDQWDGVVGYWILVRHPGDIFYTSTFSNEKNYREYVAAEDLIHLMDLRTRAEQQVGITRFASVIQHLHRMGQFDIAHVTAAIWSACKPLFLLKKFPTNMEYVPSYIRKAMEDDSSAGTDDGAKEDTAQPGETTELPYGVEPWQADPKFPLEAGPGFKRDNLRAACAGAGTPYHQIGNDLEGVNFSSGRLGENAYHDACKILQEHFVNMFRRPHFNVALEYAILSGQLKVRGGLGRLDEFKRAAHFHGRRWPYINPLQDAQADILRIEGGLDSRDNVIRNSERGVGFEEIAREQKNDKETAEAHGLDFSADPTQPTVKKGEPGQTEPNPEEGAEPPAKKGGKQTIKSRNGNGHAGLEGLLLPGTGSR